MWKLKRIISKILMKFNYLTVILRNRLIRYFPSIGKRMYLIKTFGASMDVVRGSVNHQLVLCVVNSKLPVVYSIRYSTNKSSKERDI